MGLVSFKFLHTIVSQRKPLVTQVVQADKMDHQHLNEHKEVCSKECTFKRKRSKKRREEEMDSTELFLEFVSKLDRLSNLDTNDFLIISYCEAEIESLSVFFFQLYYIKSIWQMPLSRAI